MQLKDDHVKKLDAIASSHSQSFINLSARAKHKFTNSSVATYLALFAVRFCTTGEDAEKMAKNFILAFSRVSTHLVKLPRESESLQESDKPQAE